MEGRRARLHDAATANAYAAMYRACVSLISEQSRFTEMGRHAHPRCATPAGGIVASTVTACSKVQDARSQSAAFVGGLRDVGGDS